MTGGTLHAGVKCLVDRALPLIVCAQLPNLGGKLRQGLRVFRLVLLRLSADELLTQCVKLLLLLGSFSPRVLRRLVVAPAQLYEPLLHTLDIKTGKLLCLQCRGFFLESLLLIGQLLPCLVALFRLRYRHVLLTVQVGDALLQTADLLTSALEISVRGEKKLVLQGFPHRLGKLCKDRFLRDMRQIPLQQVLAVLTQLLDEVQGVENGEKHIPLTKKVGEIELADLIAVVGDGHAVFSSRARQLMGRASLIHKAHLNGNIRVVLVVEPVNPTLPEEGEPGHGKGDGVRDAGLAAPIPAGDNSGIAKGQLRGALVGFEAGNRHAGDAELFDLVQLSAPFCCSK